MERIEVIETSSPGWQPSVITTIRYPRCVIITSMKDLYIIHMKGSGKFKVGRSKHPEIRLKQLQTGCPFDLELTLILENQGHLEKDIHRILKPYQARYMKGEWFDEEGLASLPDWIYEQIDLDNLV